MLKTYAAYISIIRSIMDILNFSASWLVVYWLRFYAPFVSSPTSIPKFSNHVKYLIPVVGLCYLAAILAGLYRVRRMVSSGRDLIDIVKASSIATLMVMAFFYYIQSASPYSRILIASFGLLLCLSTMLTHLLLRITLRFIRSKGYNIRHYAIIGTGVKAQRLFDDLCRMSWTGMKCIWFVDDDEKLIGTKIKGISVVGPVEKLPNLLSQREVDEVYLTKGGDDAQRAYSVLERLQLSGVKVRIVPDWGNLLSISKPEVLAIGSQVLFSASDSPLSGYNILIKQLFDIVASLILITLLALPMLIIAIAVKLTSKGPILYKQKRVGLDGREFNIFKFRSMVDSANKPGWTISNDPRRTKIGAFIRTTSIDELPQLFNVLKGDMSLVGPRPEQSCFVEDFSGEFRRYMLRHHVKAGMTGWAQIHGLRGDTSLRKRLAYDLYYVKNWSFALDIFILLRTPFVVLKGENAY